MNVLFVENLRFLDTTLRDGEQTPGVSLNPDQKCEIATRLADIGIDVIEVGSAAASEGERDAIRIISEAGLSAEIFARMSGHFVRISILPQTMVQTQSILWYR